MIKIKVLNNEDIQKILVRTKKMRAMNKAMRDRKIWHEFFLKIAK